MLLIILLVVFVVVLLLWFLSLTGTAPVPPSPWLPFIAVLILGVVVFLVGTGYAVPVR